MAKEALPSPPAHLPEALQKKWSSIYASALKQAEIDTPDNESAQRASARREANKLLKVARPGSHKEATALVEAFQSHTEEGWKILAHGARKIAGVDHLAIVTADGQKHFYPVPPEKSSSKTASDSK